MSQDLKLEAIRYFDFITSSPTTGAAADADSGPTAEVFEDNTDTTVVALAVTKRTSKTGNYRVPVTAAAADGFEVGKTYNVIASATVGGVAAKGKIGSFVVRARTADDFAFPTVSGRSLDVTATGEAGIDWGNVGAPTTTLDLSGTTIKTSQVVASVTGAVGSVTGAVGSVTGAVGSVTGNVGGIVTGSVGSVVGAVGSVTGNVGGIVGTINTFDMFVNASGQVTVVAFANNAVTAAAIANAAIDEATFAADTAKYQAKVWLDVDAAGTTDRYVVGWFKNGEPLYAGITLPKIRVFKIADGSDLIALAAMTEIGSEQKFRYLATTTERITAGVGYFAYVEATIGGSTRKWDQPVSRDTA